MDHGVYVTIFLIFLGASRILALEKKTIGPIVNFQFPPQKWGGFPQN